MPLSPCNCRILGLWKPGKTTSKWIKVPRLCTTFLLDWSLTDKFLCFVSDKRWWIAVFVPAIPQEANNEILYGSNIRSGDNTLFEQLPSVCDAGFWQPWDKIHEHKEWEMFTVGENMHTIVFWGIDIFYSSHIPVPAKPISTTWKHNPSANHLCISLFHVFVPQEASTKRVSLVLQRCTRVLRVASQCSSVSSSCKNPSSERLKC